jgi:microcin C transport system substrate-binding protein
VLQWGHYVIPHYHITSDRLVYWRKLHRPETTPSQGVQLDAFWFEPQKGG